MLTKTLTQVIPILTEPFVRTGIHSTPEQALKYIVLDYIDRQISWVENELRHFEQKYQQPFSEWSETLIGRATLAEEDDWMEWEALHDMAESWRELKAEIMQSNV